MTQSLETLCQLVQTTLSQEQQALTDREEALAAERKGLEEEKEAMAKVGITEGDILELNVGGELFSVKRSTLLLAPEESALNAMFSGRWDESIAKDAHGRIFLDMTPCVFRVIVSYLRTLRLVPGAKKPKVLQIDPVYQAEFQATCDYFGIFGPSARDAVLQMKALSTGIQIVETAEGSTTSTRVNTSDDHCAAFGTDTLEIGQHWKVKIVTLKSNNWVYAGVLGNERASSENSYSDATSCGWACSQQVYVSGVNQAAAGGWTCWQAGDEAIFKLAASELIMHHLRLQRKFTLLLPASSAGWRLHINLHGARDQLVLSSPSPAEAALVD